ncbi:FAD-dependent oxidoreductase [Phytoactinopolyspora halotolerans]|uniref:FAD-dependent oxidoreductase n=1 Tax=Phytoactinopolyspora halotolerans TaxID=1981512 RepID=UPI0015777314|nr:FAD-dependent oxidoreductase [Phytoactinopolyspora halotolerans]
MTEIGVDVAVIGGGLGGVAAALAAARHGMTVVLTEETDWVGGQITAQGVPSDEHPWIEQFGCTATYRSFRDGIRDYYRRHYPLTEAARAARHLNPGGGAVSRICAEPRVALAVLEAMLAPHRAAGRLDLRLRHRPVAATTDGDTVTSVTVQDEETGERLTVTARYVLDATETGELLPLTGTEYVTGFESQDDTGEPSAPAEGQPLNMQAVSWCFAVDHLEGEDHTIDKPDDYALWREFQPPYWPGPMFGLVAPKPHSLEPVQRTFEPHHDEEFNRRYGGGDIDLWQFRRIIARDNFVPGAFRSDVVIVNWPMIDYLSGPVFEVDDDEAALHLEGARRMSLSFLYWMQTEMPRMDGGTGLPGLRLRGDVFGTSHGLAKYPYIRESRRIVAEYTIVEQDVAQALRPERTAKPYDDSVGVGSYRIDLHPSTGGDNYIDVGSLPFQIPLGALLPVRMRNLLPAAKNIGTTHITNGCYRLHPVEWNVGEAAGVLAAHCVAENTTPQQVRHDEARLRAYQKTLTRDGVELRWPDVHGY